MTVETLTGEFIDLPATLLMTLDASRLTIKTDKLLERGYIQAQEGILSLPNDFQLIFVCLPVWRRDSQHMYSWDVIWSEGVHWWRGVREMKTPAMSQHNRHIVKSNRTVIGWPRKTDLCNYWSWLQPAVYCTWKRRGQGGRYQRAEEWHVTFCLQQRKKP